MSASSSISTIYSFIPTSPLLVLNLIPIPIPIISTSPENPPPRTPTFPTSLLIPTSHFPKLRVVLPRLRKRRFQLLQKKIKQPPELRKLRNAFFLLVKYCHINASTLSNPNFLHIPLTSLLISDSETPTPTLIDSGSSHCFVDTSFTLQHYLPVSSVLTSPLISDSETPTPTLIDSGSSHCFVDTSFTLQHYLPVSSVLTSPLISDSETPTPTLIDSGSSHCFVDTLFTLHHNLPVSSVPALSASVITSTL